MNDPTASIVTASQKKTLGDRIRTIATQLRQEDDIQIKATSRILGAAAKIAENHDRLIDEVVEMVEDDLNRGNTQSSNSTPYTVRQLKQQFPKFTDAKTYFGVKASSWTALVDKLNEASPGKATSSKSAQGHSATTSSSEDLVSSRLNAIEQELHMLRGDMNQMLQLLEQLVASVS